MTDQSATGDNVPSEDGASQVCSRFQRDHLGRGVLVRVSEVLVSLLLYDTSSGTHGKLVDGVCRSRVT